MNKLIENIQNLRSKKIILYLITVIIFISLILILLIRLSFLSKKEKSPSLDNSSKSLIREGFVYFNPTILTIDKPNGTLSSQIIIKSNSPISGMNLNLQYDPSQIELLSFVPFIKSGSFLSTAKTTNNQVIHNNIGKAEISIELSPGSQELIGNGSIGTLVFKIKNIKVGSNTLISFTENTSLYSRKNTNAIKVGRVNLEIFRTK